MKRLSILLACLHLFFASMLTVFDAAKAEDISFTIANDAADDGVSLGELTAILQPRTTVIDRLVGSGLQEGSNSFIAQTGTFNNAQNTIINSEGGATATLQAGNRNSAQSNIINSPNSIIAQVQIGSDNRSVANIIGGRDNAISSAQIGSGLVSGITLVNAIDVTVTRGQIDPATNGSLTIVNAPPGAHITLD